MALLPLLSGLIGENGLFGKYLKTKAETAQATADFNLQYQKAQLDYASKMAEAAVNQQANQLAATSQSFKFVSYTLLTLPILIVCFFPSYGKDIFNNLGLIPSWYAQLYVAVVAVIWGLPVASNVVGNIFAGVQSAWDARQDKKIEKIQAIGEAKAGNLDAAKKEIFDTLRKATGALSQAQVDSINPVLDKVITIQQQATANASETK